MTPAQPLLACRAVEWQTGGRRILGPLDLELTAGETLAVIGPNGAGKTTLLRLVAGLLEPTAGEVRLRGEPYPSIPRRRLAHHVAYVPQIRPARVPLSVEEVVLQGRFPHLSRWRLAPSEADFAAVREALAVVGIADLRHRRLDELSGGERQAAYVAAALAQEGELLILDEPTTHLDPRHQRGLSELLLRLGRRRRHGVLAATHDLHLASRVADRVLALRDGRILALGSTEEVLRPGVLEDLFDTPFRLLAEGRRQVPVLELEP
ncbi:MAG: ABC transporter ATP-binding protein [Acidobacteria bacterium]|nr:ABC transporter ATP-binding protein [Acidobacteriota bacterium]